MDLDEAVNKAIQDNPKVKEDFAKKPQAANKLIGAVRRLGCMADPKLVKKKIYESLGSEWVEEEKKTEEVHRSEPSGWFLWRNKETGEIVRRDFQFNEKGTAAKVGDLWVYYSIYPSRTIGDFKLKVEEWVERFSHIDTDRAYTKAEYILHFTRITDKDYVPEEYRNHQGFSRGIDLRKDR